jgi:hypothetical protein
MTRWQVRLRYYGPDKQVLEATAQTDGLNGHDAIVRAINAVKEQAPGITVMKVDATPLRET